MHHISPSDRQSHLTQRRRMKMAESAHAYVRGNTVKFYEWLESTRAAELIPSGPPIWICGDCHVGNLGPVASSDGKIEIQVRDFDQTVIGNPAHDIIRLSLSLAMAARSSNLPGITTALMMEQVVEGYRAGLHERRSTGKVQDSIEPVRKVMRQALRRKWRNLAEERIEDVKPKIPLGKRFWALSKKERAGVDHIFQEEDTRKLVTCLHSRSDRDPITVLDAAYWMKGCSSLGRLRYAVLLGIGKDAAEMCLIDIKESTKAAAPRAKNASMPSGNAERVVTGARALSPFLDQRMLAVRLEDRGAVLRELMPQDLKFEIERLTRDEAIAAARLFSNVVGRAHARQMDSTTRHHWSREMARNQSKTLDAPSWLWSSMVDLVAVHEAAYLDHCRACAMQ